MRMGIEKKILIMNIMKVLNGFGIKKRRNK